MIWFEGEVNLPAPISNDLRERVVLLYALSGVTYQDVADTLGIGRATVSRVLHIHRETGGVDPLPATGGQKPILGAVQLDQLRAMVTARPDATLEELTGQWNAEHPEYQLSSRTLGRGVAALGFTRKKSP